MLKKYRKYWFICLEIIIGIVCIILDSIFDLKNNLFSDFLPLVFETMVVVAGFWVTLYLLFVELFKDRYPFKFIKEKYLVVLKGNAVYIVFCLVYGAISIVRKDYILEASFYLLTSGLAIIVIGRHVYDTSKTMMVSNYVKEYCDNLSRKFSQNESVIDEDTLDDLNRVFEECIIKEEFLIAQNISNCSGDVFRDFMKKSIDFIDNGSDRKQVETSFKRIAGFGRMQLEKCYKIDSVILKSDIVTQQYLNLKFCIDTNQFEFYKLYIKRIIDLTNDSQRDHKDELVEITYDLYLCVLEYLIDEEKKEWIEYLLEKAYQVTLANVYFFTNEYAKDFVRLITFGLVKGKEETLYDSMIGFFKKTTNSLCCMSYGFKDSIIYYNLILNELAERKNDYLERFIELVFGEYSTFCHDSKWIEFKFHCVDRIKQIEKMNDKTNEYLLSLLMQVIELKETYKGYMFLPDFMDEIYSGSFSKDKMDSINSIFERLFERTIVNDNISFFYMLIREHSRCVLESKRDKKDIQEALFSNYMWLIERTRRLNNKQYVEMTFATIKDDVYELDKEKEISKEFGEIIINKIEQIAHIVDSKTNYVTIQVIDILHEFSGKEERYNFCAKKEKQHLLARAIYNIAINCIENDYEEGIRNASNALGWMTIQTIKNGVVDQVKYLLQLAKKMLEIARKMNVSCKTETFIVTLFTTVGMYCFKESSYAVYREFVFDSIKKVQKDVVYTAIEIRTYENNMWDSLMDNNTQRFVKEFKKEYDRRNSM